MSRAAGVGKRAASRRPTRSIPCPGDADRRDDRHGTGRHETNLDAYIARLLDDAPPLTSEQRDALALILRVPRHR